MTKTRKVLIIQRSLPHYRADFFQQLKKRLEAQNVQLTLVYGKLKNENSLKKDEVDLPWATYLPSTVFNIRNIELYWQPCIPFLKDQELVIVEQVNKNLINYYLMIKRLFSKLKFAQWGHGQNLQAKSNDAGNKFKKLFINQSDWWFAYTDRVKKYLISNGFPGNKITSVQNAIDTLSLIKHYPQVSDKEIQVLKENLQINSNNIGLFCGGIYKEKCIDFLIEASDKIKKQVEDFHLILIGSGPDVNIIQEAAKTRPWVHYVGTKFGTDKVAYFKASSFFLMPGLVGLGILDSFAMQTPMITTDYPYHSPEIEYLENGINGLMTANNVEAYTQIVVNALKDKNLQAKLQEGCRQSADKFTIEKMAENFSNGIINCLNFYNK